MGDSQNYNRILKTLTKNQTNFFMEFLFKKKKKKVVSVFTISEKSLKNHDFDCPWSKAFILHPTVTIYLQ